MPLPNLKAPCKKKDLAIQWGGQHFSGGKIQCSWLWLEHKLCLPKATEQPRGLGKRLPPAALTYSAKCTFSQKSSPSVLLTPQLWHAKQWLLCCSLWVTEPRFIIYGSTPGPALTEHVFKNRKIPADNLNIWFDIFVSMSGVQKADYCPWTGFPPSFQHPSSSPSSLWLYVCDQ